MPVRLDSPLVQPVGAATAAARIERTADPRLEAMARVLQPMLGKSMQAEVLARLTDGSALVRVAGLAARMQLPPTLAPGSRLDMTLMAIAPRPAFQLDSAETPQTLLFPDVLPDGPDGAASSLRTLRAAALFGSQQQASAAQTAAELEGSPIRLSDTARALAGVLAAALKSPDLQAAIVARTPLLAGRDAPPTQVAAALKDAITVSGLFYESHVAEWAGGKRSLDELMREPQMQNASAAPEPAPGRPSAGIDPSAAQLVNLQLATDEHMRVGWQGQVWPGQHMEWDVSKEEHRDGGAAGDDTQALWRSGLRLRFPLLGEIAGHLVLEGGRLHIQLQACSPEAGTLLRRHAGALGAALEAAGNPLTSLEITDRKNDGDV